MTLPPIQESTILIASQNWGDDEIPRPTCGYKHVNFLKDFVKNSIVEVLPVVIATIATLFRVNNRFIQQPLQNTKLMIIRFLIEKVGDHHRRIYTGASLFPTQHVAEDAFRSPPSYLNFTDRYAYASSIVITQVFGGNLIPIIKRETSTA